MYKVLLIVVALSALLLSGCAKDTVNESFPATPAVSVPAETGPTASAPTETESPSATLSFEAIDLEGNAVSSDVFSQSKLTMLNVWATYCDPCLREMPDLGELAAEYDAEEFQLIGIVSDVLEGEDQSLAESLVQETEANYPHLLLNESLYYSLLYNVSSVPTTFFLDENGTPLGYVIGANDKATWEEIINGLLEEL